jgi:hypothetical protein
LILAAALLAGQGGYCLDCFDEAGEACHHQREHVIRPAQPPGRIDLAYAGHNGRSAINKAVKSR